MSLLVDDSYIAVTQSAITLHPNLLWLPMVKLIVTTYHKDSALVGGIRQVEETRELDHHAQQVHSFTKQVNLITTRYECTSSSITNLHINILLLARRQSSLAPYLRTSNLPRNQNRHFDKHLTAVQNQHTSAMNNASKKHFQLTTINPAHGINRLVICISHVLLNHNTSSGRTYKIIGIVRYGIISIDFKFKYTGPSICSNNHLLVQISEFGLLLILSGIRSNIMRVSFGTIKNIKFEFS